MAELSELKNQNGDNLLVKKLKKKKTFNKDSVLNLYINRIANSTKNSTFDDDLIFPFGCNNSQFKAVKMAMSNKLSIIQGPPGTGKTQTILNIIANLLIKDKTVLIVSNNNSATSNIKEKLASKKYGMGFLCAILGCKENIDFFIQNQKQSYPEHLNEWLNYKPVLKPLLTDEIKSLKEYFDLNERIALLENELKQLETEYIHFHNNNQNIELYSNSKLAQKISNSIMDVWQTLQTKLNTKEKLGFFTKLNLYLRYKIGNRFFWKIDSKRTFYTIKEYFYLSKKNELIDELSTYQKQKESFNPEKVYEESLSFIKTKLALKYTKNEAPIFLKVI